MIYMDSARASATVAGVAWLAEMDFADGMWRVTTAPRDLLVGGNTFQGLGSMVGVSDLTEGPDSAAAQLTLSLSAANSALFALAMGRVEGYRGRGVRLYLQLFDEAMQPVGSPVLRWRGVMNKVSITRKPAAVGSTNPSTGSVDMLCSRTGMARARHSQGLRLTDAQQQARYPGDTGLRYVRTLIEQPALWQIGRAHV